MIRRRLHIAGARRRSKIRLNSKFDMKRRQASSDRIQEEEREIHEYPVPRLEVPETEVLLGNSSDEAFFVIRNTGGQPLQYNFFGFPDWMRVVNEAGLQLMDDGNYAPDVIEPGHYKRIFIKADEDMMSLGSTTGAFEIASTGGNQTINVTTERGDPWPPPSHIGIHEITETKIRIGWKNSWGGGDNGSQVNIYASNMTSRPNTPLVTLAGNASSYLHQNLSAGQTWYYWVEFENNDGQSSQISISATTLSLPDVDPTNLRINTIDVDRANITWDGDPTNSDGTYIYVSTNNSIPNSPSYTVSGNPKSFNLINLTPATTYYVWIAFFNTVGLSQTTQGPPFHTPAAVPDADPINLIIDHIDEDRASIKWTNNCTNADNVLFAYSDRDVKPPVEEKLNANASAHLLGRLSPDTKYYVWITFGNSYGVSATLTGSFETIGGWTQTQLILKAGIVSDPSVDMTISADNLENFLINPIGISTGDRLLITNTFEKSEELTVKSVDSKSGDIIVSRDAKQALKIMDKGSTIRINHDIEWYVAGRGIKINDHMKLESGLVDDKRNRTIDSIKPVVGPPEALGLPVIRVGDYIKINNEIMGPVIELGAPSNQIQIDKITGTFYVDLTISVSKKKKGDDTLFTVSDRAVLGTTVAKHLIGDDINVNHK